MIDETPSLRMMIDAVLDGDPLDWSVAEAAVEGEATADLVRRLRDVASIRRAYSQLAAADRQHPPTPPRGPRGGLPDGSIGGLELIRQVGEGPMGVVYAARRESQPSSVLALKLIRWPLDVAQVLARFERLRPILRDLDDPRLARVLDAGETEEGRLFFVSGYVEGTPIVAYCNERRLSLDERLDLFAVLCAAVQQTHDLGLAHGSIKPTNILVADREGGPVPRLLELGLAESMRQRLTEWALFARLGRLVENPCYHSPEETTSSGPQSGRRSDVYALGVLLYELLTGVLPFDAAPRDGAGLRRLRRQIQNQPPTAPSRAVASDTLADRFDQPILRALRKDPERRWPDAAALRKAVQAAREI